MYEQNHSTVTDLAKFLGENGYHSIAKNLPGHGTTVEECNRIKFPDWFDFVKQDIAKLASVLKKIFVIGGAQIYRHFIHQSDALHITLINADTNGIDTYFPVSILTIQNEFNKVGEYPLGKNALYTHWIKNDFPGLS